jgi:hypothetical protein
MTGWMNKWMEKAQAAKPKPKKASKKGKRK